MDALDDNEAAPFFAGDPDPLELVLHLSKDNEKHNIYHIIDNRFDNRICKTGKMPTS
jgi:hypothetical protein